MILNDNEKISDFENIKYFYHYSVAWKIFKDNPILGVGNKNFRWDCHRPKYFSTEKKLSEQMCSTHPHQIHFELLSEQGIVGYILIMGVLLNFSIKLIINSYKKNQIFKFSLCLYIFAFLLPLLPGGGIFSTYSGSNFWLVIALLNYLNNNEKNKFL